MDVTKPWKFMGPRYRRPRLSEDRRESDLRLKGLLGVGKLDLELGDSPGNPPGAQTGPLYDPGCRSSMSLAVPGWSSTTYGNHKMWSWTRIAPVLPSWARFGGIPAQVNGGCI